MNSLQESILKVVVYFDIFYYPVTIHEIRYFMDSRCDELKLLLALNELLKNEIIFKTKDYYSFHKDQIHAIKRVKANAVAKKHLKIAKRVAAFLTWFPFIKGVAISGSLSKNVAYEGSDIDFFIITRANRLWLSKLFFSILIKCTTITGLKKWFCLNYMVDETSLEVPEKNIFTATEIITLLPLHGASLFNDFFSANDWVYDFFPNYPVKTHGAKEPAFILPKKLIEWLLNNKHGDKANNLIMDYFDKRWKKLRAKNKFTESGFQIGTMMTDKHFCRPFPEHFQQKILDSFNEKMKTLKANLTITV
jgi:hypothetical protein